VEHTTQFRSLGEFARRERNPGDDAAALAQRAWFERHANRDKLQDYASFIAKAREHYRDIAFGLEVDWLGDPKVANLSSIFEWDFLIGSVHFIDGYAADNPGLLGVWSRLSVAEVYERYFALLRDAVESRAFDILGHLDVLKMVRPLCLGKDSRSLDSLVDSIAAVGITVEVNTAFSYRQKARDEFCPSREILLRLVDRGVPLTLSSDSHHPDHVGCNLDKAAELLRSLGVVSVRRFWRRHPEDVSLR
jgi:histidinol-phosphatase (PHP family)